MDTSETFVRMCENTEEIQKYWMITCGDYACIKHPKDRRIVLVTTGQSDLDRKPTFLSVVFPKSYGDNIDLKKVENLLWLPRQDQLQEMVATKILSYDIGAFLRWCIANVFPNDTWEQLWLAFVMKEKYNKIWNKENWIAP